jgi:Pentapeptide repeats (8 copies)
MVVTFIVCLAAAIIGACIALGLNRGYVQRISTQQVAWERAQESHQRSWESGQAQQFAAMEQRLSRQVQQVKQECKAWEEGDQQRLEALRRQHAAYATQLQLQNELERLPRIEEVPVFSPLEDPLKHAPANWRPPQLHASKLSGHDLSHRFLALADLRNADLVQTNFFMADLSGAVLSGAHLAGADLAGANLSGADLRGADLGGANLLVADLRAAILLGTDLRGARNVTLEQLASAVYDSSTQIDTEITLSALSPATPRPEALEKGEALPDHQEELPLLSSLLAPGDGVQAPRRAQSAGGPLLDSATPGPGAGSNGSAGAEKHHRSGPL